MLTNLWRKCRQLLAGPVGRENRQLLATMTAQMSVVRGLNDALGHTHEALALERYERLVFLGALALQAGGELTLPLEFIETVQGGNYSVNISPTEDKKALVIRLLEQEPAGESDTNCGGCGCG